MELKHPQKGEKLRFVEWQKEMLKYVDNKEKEKIDMVLELKRF